jgi:GTP pyrophosphokinase
MPQDDLLLEIQDIAKNVKQRLPGFDVKKFLKAYEFAEMAHRGQLRKDGGPYIIHPVATVRVLSHLKVDEDTLIAALLHDVPEDTSHTVEEIDQLFGSRIAFLVEGITKLSKVHYQNDMEGRQVESLKKLLIHTAKDPRVILIKLADRLHNMRTLHFVTKPEKVQRISRETLEIYVPMASLLGIQGIKSELEDLCFQHLYPLEYEMFAKKIHESESRLLPKTEETTARVGEVLRSHHIDAKVFPRQKTLYSIFNKVRAQRKTIEDIHDLITLRILVPSIEDAYRALGIIHVMFKPKPGYFKDYIAVPKINGYRSLHTTIFGIDGTPTEFQIRTFEMDNEAEYGITTHYFLGSKMKRGKRGDGHTTDWKTRWMTDILELEQQEVSSRSFVEKVKSDIFEDKIFVFTPKGDAIHLPKNATAVDFAYAIHSDIGNQAFGVEINGQRRPLSSPLKSGDTVHIFTSLDSPGPKREWLDFAKTGISKNRIREFLHKENINTKIRTGKQLLQKAFSRAGIGLIEDIPFKRIQSALVRAHYPEYHLLSELLSAVGDGTLEPVDVIRSLYPEQRLTHISRSQSFLSFGRSPTRERVRLRIIVEDRPGMVSDIVHVLSRFQLNIINMSGHGKGFLGKSGEVNVTIELERYDTLQHIFTELEQIEGVLNVSRVFRMKEAGFVIFAFMTVVFWLIHPILIEYSLGISNNVLVYIGLGMLLVLAFYLRRFTPRYILRLQEGKSMLITTGFITLFVLITLVWEITYYEISTNWLVVFIIFMAIFYLGFEYWDYRRKKLY